MARPKGSKNKPKLLISYKQLVDAITEDIEIVREVVERQSTELKALGFHGFSAKHILADVNLALEQKNRPALLLRQLKRCLTALGYVNSEKQFNPHPGVTYTAWYLPGEE